MFLNSKPMFSHSSSSLSSHPLFSSIITFFLLILLYFPSLFSILIFSPVLLLTLTLLLSLLRLGATQTTHNKPEIYQTITKEEEEEEVVVVAGHTWETPETESEDKASCVPVPCPCFDDTFVEWNVRAPLDVIYEEYEGEGEEEEDKDGFNETDPFEETVPRPVCIERYPSLSLYYPETDSDSSSEGEFPTPGAWDSLDNICFMWDDDDEDEKEELIEISLEKNKKLLVSEFQFDEENLIEIDISPMRNDENEDFSR